ncbi:unnamed protein product, partial [Mesorhabditis belari]|uniref:Uncharacterized protein n=1 Tax=Mesorhabditis belari TaxID=2138241 RepID=A0AAF3FVE2_9BILA
MASKIWLSPLTPDRIVTMNRVIFAFLMLFGLIGTTCPPPPQPTIGYDPSFGNGAYSFAFNAVYEVGPTGCPSGTTCYNGSVNEYCFEKCDALPFKSTLKIVGQPSFRSSCSSSGNKCYLTPRPERGTQTIECYA